MTTSTVESGVCSMKCEVCSVVLLVSKNTFQAEQFSLSPALTSFYQYFMIIKEIKVVSAAQGPVFLKVLTWSKLWELPS